MKRVCKWHACQNEVIGQRNKEYCNKRCVVKAAVTRKRRQLKLQAVEYLGGACALCGYNKCIQALQFHHVMGQKDFAISVLGHTKSWKKIEKELKKCELLCANCHAEIHAEKYVLV
jgi:predicted HNH restriction endonuclease